MLHFILTEQLLIFLPFIYHAGYDITNFYFLSHGDKHAAAKSEDDIGYFSRCHLYITAGSDIRDFHFLSHCHTMQLKRVKMTFAFPQAHACKFSITTNQRTEEPIEALWLAVELEDRQTQRCGYNTQKDVVILMTSHVLSRLSAGNNRRRAADMTRYYEFCKNIKNTLGTHKSPPAGIQQLDDKGSMYLESNSGMCHYKGVVCSLMNTSW